MQNIEEKESVLNNDNLDYQSQATIDKQYDIWALKKTFLSV